MKNSDGSWNIPLIREKAVQKARETGQRHAKLGLAAANVHDIIEGAYPCGLLLDTARTDNDLKIATDEIRQAYVAGYNNA